MTRRGGRPAWLGVRDDGSTALELAILWPLVVLLVLLGVQVALVIHSRTVALAAAQQGAMAEAAYGAPPGAGYAATDEFLDQRTGALDHREVTVERTGQEVRVTVSGTSTGWLGLPIPISQTAYAGLERFTTEVDP